MDIIEKVRKLDFPAGQYLVFGSGPLMVHGIRESRDIDLLVTSELYAQLKADPSWKVMHWPDGAEYLANGDYEVDDIWHYNDYQPKTNELIAKAEVIEDVPFAPLDEVIKWKRAFGRPKDLADVELIEAYLSKS
jgi:hypothetical protein